MSQTKAQLVSGTTAQDLTVDNINTTSVNSGKISGRKNIIINGAMLVAQRSTDITTGDAGVHCVDRIDGESLNADEAPRRQQVDVSSSSTPYTLGFRKAFKLTNGNQTGGAGASDIMNIRYNIEAQDISQSGWNYKSASSFVTLQFWIKSSVSQNFNMYVRTRDGTNQTYAFDTGTLSADTWTKITKTIPGNSNIQLDNDNGQGLQLNFGPFWGTDRTDNSVNNEEWKTYASSSRMKDNATNWYTTDNATLEMTGLQLEVGSTATDFEHRSFAEELQLCQRYYFKFCEGISKEINVAWYFTSGHISFFIRYPTTMRAAPTLSITTGSNYYILYRDGSNDQFDGFASEFISTEQMSCFRNSQVSGTAGQAGILRTFNSAAKVEISAEI